MVFKGFEIFVIWAFISSFILFLGVTETYGLQLLWFVEVMITLVMVGAFIKLVVKK